jgi:uncharacterized protein YybS (DUF2232 family)
MNIESPTGHNLLIRLKAALLGVVGSFVLFAAYLAVPPIGIFSGMLAPFPAAYNRLVYGRMPSLIILLGSTAAITAIFGFFAGFLYFGMCGMISYLMPELLLLGFSCSRTLFWTTAANVAFFAVGFIAYSSVSGVDLQGLVSNEISGSIKQAVAIYEKAGVKGEDLDLLKRSMATGADLLSKLFPALVATLFVIIAGGNLALLKRTTLKLNLPISIGELNTFRTPDLLVWVLITAGFAMLLPTSIITTPALNILLVVSMIYFIQGMAVVGTMISKSSVSAIVRIILYVMLIIQPYLLALIAGIGLFDLWVDFRTPKTQENL